MTSLINRSNNESFVAILIVLSGWFDLLLLFFNPTDNGIGMFSKVVGNGAF